MKKKLLLLMCLWSSMIYAEDLTMPTQTNLVTSAKSAIQLAEVYIENIYGEETAQRQKPYTVEYVVGTWHIKGKPPPALGGRFTIIISAEDGRVIEYSHSK